MGTQMVLARRRHGVSRHNGHDGRDLNARLQSLRGDLGALQEDVRLLVTDMGAVASGQVQGAVRQTAKRVETWGNEQMPSMRKVVRSNPFAACAVAISAGALLGAMLFRR